MPIIQAPFRDVSVHIVQAPGIRRKASHPFWFSSCNSTGPIRILDRGVVVRKLWADRGAKIERCGCARPACIFPLGFARKGVVPRCSLAEAMAELHRVVPTHVHHRPIITIQLGRGRRQLPLQRLPICHRPPLGLCDRRAPHKEALELHLMLGAFKSFPLGFLQGGSHPEAPRRDPDHSQVNPFRKRFPEQLALAATSDQEPLARWAAAGHGEPQGALQHRAGTSPAHLTSKHPCRGRR